MPRRFQMPVPDHLREPHEVNVPGLWNVYILGIGIAILLGLVGGSLWILWRLLAARFVDWGVHHGRDHGRPEPKNA